MIIGVPKEIKKEEYRVGITPPGVKELRRIGHTVLIETDAGEGSGFSSDEYLEADADIVDKQTVFEKADLIVKVKEPLSSEYGLFREGQAVFTYLHLAPNPGLTDFLLKQKITALGYETLQKDGGLPLLSPMSAVAGRMAPIIGAYYLQMIHGGTGVLCAGVPGVRPARALILGAGVVGTNASRVCLGMGMDTLVISKGEGRLQRIDDLFMGKVKTLPVTMHAIEEEISGADIVIGAVLVPGGRTPLLITRDMLRTMKKGAVIVDVSVDQGGCVETSRPTTHDSPVYKVDGIIHYAVANMPGAYPRTSTLALTNATLPYVKALANTGIEKVIRSDAVIRTALNTYRGEIVHRALADSIGAPYRSLEEIM
jgi:alanine dehydrogenase